jgi:hypothetical protein
MTKWQWNIIIALVKVVIAIADKLDTYPDAWNNEFRENLQILEEAEIRNRP